MASLPSNYVLKSLLKHHHSTDLTPNYLSLENLISKQRLKVKSSIVAINNYLNRILPLLIPCIKKFLLASD